MIEFFQRLFGRPSSSATAKERLRLVLLSDHLSLAPDVVDALKHDLIEVISRYCDVDVANCDVSFEQQDRVVAMLANIPILGMRERSKPPSPPPAAPPRAPEPPPSLGTAGATVSAGAALEAEPAPVAVTEPDAAPQPQPKPARKRRRRRSNAPGTNGTTHVVSGTPGLSSI